MNESAGMFRIWIGMLERYGRRNRPEDRRLRLSSTAKRFRRRKSDSSLSRLRSAGGDCGGRAFREESGDDGGGITRL